MLEQEIHIALRFRLASGKVTLNEIVYRLQELRDSLMVRILQTILLGYDDLICERLSETCPSKSRRGLGRHLMRGAACGRWCRCRRVRHRFRRFWSKKVHMPQRLVVPRVGMGDDRPAGRSAPSAVIDLPR